MHKAASMKIGPTFWFLILLASLMAVPCSAQIPHAIVLDGAGPWQDARWTLGVTQFTSLLTDAGYQINTVSPADLASAPPASDVLLAAPSLESLPLAAFKAVAAFLAAGGALMASGGEPFRDPLYPASNGSWIDQISLLQALTPEKTVLNPATAALSEAFYVPEPITRATVIGPDGQSAALDFQLQMSTAQFYLLTAPVAAPAFNAGQTATIVWTRGTPGQSMMLEWDETDGSRWIAIVPLTTQWTKQVLLPSEFRYYAGPPARAATTFNPAQASLLYFGVATNQGALPGPIEFALGSIGVASTPPAFEAFTPPLLETLSPGYKQYVTERAGQSVRVPITRGRGLSATPDPDGRYHAIGDLLSPAATWYVKNSGTAVIWLPWPQLQDPDRAQLVAQLRAASSRLYLMNAGPAQIVTVPSEDINLGARVLNAGPASAAANLLWSISDSTGTGVARFTSTLSVAAGGLLTVPATDAGRLPPGDYSITASLTVATQEIDRIDGRVRVVRPTSEFQPDQRITVANGAFSTGAGHPLFLQGVNYWPRYTAALEPARFYQSWLSPQNYDPDVVEADLGLLASLNFNMVSIHYFGTDGARSIVDFLDRCRRHGIWVDISIDAFGGGAPSILNRGQLLGINSSYITSLLQSAFLTGNDRVLAFSLLSEPFLGVHSDRLGIDSAWRAWITDQYGTAANAENIWAFTAPRDAQGQISNPLDSQIQNDGPWRGMVAAYRRFIDDFLSRSIGAAARLVRSISPGTLISYRNGGSAAVNADYSLLGEGLTMMQEMNYDFGTAAAHLDFIAPHAYFIPIPWPDGRGLGVEAAYARYRSGGKPVYWTEYGINIGDAGLGMATQAATCDSVMRLVSEDGSGAAAAWWMPGGWRPDEGSDYGILNPDGSPRQCATILSQWGAAFQTTPPAQPAGTPVKITIDRDADARGDVGVFLRWQKDYVTARQAGSPAVLVDAGTGTDTSTMPFLQVGNFSYVGSGPLKYANGEFAGIHLQCPGVDVRVENGDQVKVPAGSACLITMTLVNTGAASWLPAARGNRGVVLHTSAGDLPLANPLGYLQRTDFGPLKITAGEGEVDITGRLSIQGLGPFGETLRFSLVSGARSAINVPITAGGAVSNSTLGTSAAVQAGFATLSVKLGFAPYGTAVFSFKQDGVTVSEAGVPASAPTTSARIFIDYRSAAPAVPGRIDAGSIDVDTGVAVVNNGPVTAKVVYTLRGTSGGILSVGHGTIAAGTHFAKFINQLTDVEPDFKPALEFPHRHTVRIARNQQRPTSFDRRAARDHQSEK